jgi:hypothetical protein
MPVEWPFAILVASCESLGHPRETGAGVESDVWLTLPCTIARLVSWIASGVSDRRQHQSETRLVGEGSSRHQSPYMGLSATRDLATSHNRRRRLFSSWARHPRRSREWRTSVKPPNRQSRELE